MYLASTSRPGPAATSGSGPRARSRVAADPRGISRTVLALGAVSLITDVSAEMVTAILPVFLVVGLGLSPFAYGLLDGLYTGATVLLRLVGGYVADRVRARKAVAATGYGISAVAKLGLLAAGSSTGMLGLAITVDRAGKGLRSAPRDALITLSTPPTELGRAFGVHRAMDSAGAMVGPIVAVAVLAASAQSYDAVFFTSFCIAALGVVVLALYVQERTDPLERSRPAPSLPATFGLLADAPVRRLALAAAGLGLVTVGDGFVYLLLARQADLALGWFPLLAVATSAVYLLLAVPAGVLADRIGRTPVMLTGYALLVGVYLSLFGPLGGWTLVAVVVGAYGAFYATTDGVLMAIAGPLLPEHLRTSGIALIQSSQALAYLASSSLFGLAWQQWGPETALHVAALTVAVAIVGTGCVLRPRALRTEFEEAAC